MVTERRVQRMRRVASQRTAYVTLLLDDVHDPHNLAAVLRSADAFGVGSVHAIEDRQRIRVSRRVARGTDAWVDLFRYPSASVAVTTLRRQGLAIWVAAGDADAVTLDDWDGSRPTAFVFGNEHSGVRDEIRRDADAVFAIPMVGMVESLNISVACALTLRQARFRLETRLESGAPDFRLDLDQQEALLSRWGQLHHAEAIV